MVTIDFNWALSSTLSHYNFFHYEARSQSILGCKLSIISVCCRRCRGCRKKRSLRTNSFFAQHAKVALGELLLMMYFWSMDQSRKQTSRMMNANNNLVCQVFRSLEDICSTDIARNPFIPFGRRTAVKCDESKFNHKAKMSSTFRNHLK